MSLSSPLTALHGIGPRTAEDMAALGLSCVEDLLRFFPADYDRAEPVSLIADSIEGYPAAIRGVITAAPQSRGFGKGAVLTFPVEDESGKIGVTFFHMPYLKNTLKPGTERVFRGVIRKTRWGLRMEHPRLYDPEEYQKIVHAILPVYPLAGSLTQKRLRDAVRQALPEAGSLKDRLPEALIPGGMPLAEAVRAIHFPADERQLEAARQRLVYEEFLLFILKVRLLKQAGQESENRCPMPDTSLAKAALAALPYRLTGAQERALADIAGDLAGDHMMNRLLQGDVGSGKTVLALLAMLTAAGNGYQSALMAPTEVLARQHYEKISSLLKAWSLPVEAALLVGSQKAAERRLNAEKTESGQASLIIGTHALILNKMKFHRLGLVITDEQHRFGVRQRDRLAGKGGQPHILVMSATPIPRTLAIILYGDLDVSVIDELPGGRRPIQNALIRPAGRGSAYRLILKQIREGRQAYIICPLVEESEGTDAENVHDYSERIREIFPEDVRIASLHGRMKPEEKNAVMEAFLKGEVQLLVSTTVVEVGVDVPNATVMMVENAERFGLAQLHQLRGRVGRGEQQSYAIFVNGYGRPEKAKRLEILTRSNDGFAIAEEDLKLRGPGDLFGIRQSGDLHFRLGDIYRDHALLETAAGAAAALLKADPGLAHHGQLRETVLQYQESDSIGDSL